MTALALTPAQQTFYELTFNNGYNKWAGLRMIGMEIGAARIAFTPRAEMLTPWGTLNGGVLTAWSKSPRSLRCCRRLSRTSCR